MDTAVMVDTLHRKGCKFFLTRNFKDLAATQEAVQLHHRAVQAGTQRKLIVMAIQNELIPDYTILVTAGIPREKEVEQYGFFPVRKDTASWIPIQYRNRTNKEHHQSRDGDFEHTTNYTYLPLEEVHEYLDMKEKSAKIELIYK